MQQTGQHECCTEEVCGQTQHFGVIQQGVACCGETGTSSSR